MTGKEVGNSVTAVFKALNLLEIISEEKEIGVRELGRRSGINRSTVQRLVNTLEEAGYVSKSTTSQKYHLSFKLYQLGNRAMLQYDLRTIARPELEKLALKTRETVVLGILIDKDIVYLDKITYPQEMELASSIGSRVPIHCTATGKAILAFLPQDELQSVLTGKDLSAYTSKTITDIAVLKQDLNKTLQRGYSIDDEERFPGVVSIGAPIFNYQKKVVAALSLPGFRHRITGERIPVIAEMVIKTSMAISTNLGYVK